MKQNPLNSLTLGLKESKRDWRAARVWLKRNTLTGLEGKLKLATRGYVQITTHLFDRVVTRGEQLPDGTVSEMQAVWPAQWFQPPPSTIHDPRTTSHESRSTTLAAAGLRGRANGPRRASCQNKPGQECVRFTAATPPPML